MSRSAGLLWKEIGWHKGSLEDQRYNWMVKHLPGMCKALNSIPSITNKRKGKKISYEKKQRLEERYYAQFVSNSQALRQLNMFERTQQSYVMEQSDFQQQKMRSKGRQRTRWVMKSPKDFRVYLEQNKWDLQDFNGWYDTIYPAQEGSGPVLQQCRQARWKLEAGEVEGALRPLREDGGPGWQSWREEAGFCRLPTTFISHYYLSTCTKGR